MLDLLNTLIKGANARVVDRTTDHFAIDLINQKIREAENAVASSKTTLASLIMRQRQEQKSLTQLQARRKSIEANARKALEDGKTALARDAATAIADLENEEIVRTETLNRLDERVQRMRLSIEKAHRRVVDLRQSAMAASAIDMERKSQKRINRTIGGTNAMQEAEKLIKRVTSQDDVLEQDEVLEEIDRSLTHENIADRLAHEGYGDTGKVSADDVLARLSKTADPE